MPHFLVEYSSNLEDALDLPVLFEKLHTVAGKSGVFPVAGMRSRGLPRRLSLQARITLLEERWPGAFAGWKVEIR